MTEHKTTSSRRAFFLNGGAALGAGVATTAAAAALVHEKPAHEEPTSREELKRLRQQMAGMEDRDAIRGLQHEFTALIEKQAYEAATELFAERAELNLSGVGATGKVAIARLFAEQYRGQDGVALHGAYRQRALQHTDTVVLGDNRLQATATFHVEVELCTPLQGDCTAAKMARLQGQMADRRWESGRFEGQYVKRRGQWKIAALNYLST